MNEDQTTNDNPYEWEEPTNSKDINEVLEKVGKRFGRTISTGGEPIYTKAPPFHEPVQALSQSPMTHAQETEMFECQPRCEFPKIEGVTFSCDKCIKHTMIQLSQEEKEKILVILNERKT